MSILTSKNIVRTKLILNDILYLFDSINTPDLKIKTKQILIKFFCNKKAQSNIENTIFIGDSIYDKMAAHSAGVKFLYAAYGYGKFKSNYCLNKFNELKTLSDHLNLVNNLKQNQYKLLSSRLLIDFSIYKEYENINLLKIIIKNTLNFIKVF